MKTFESVDNKVEQETGTKRLVFDIQRFSLHDGPGIRTIVFLKGCPLQCQWCANPESISQRRELAFWKTRCDKCGKCAPACPEQAITLDGEGIPIIDRALCNMCGDCASVCFPGALMVYGREMTPAEAFEEVRRDQIFYDGSGGGVTASGGEPLLYPTFVRELFTLCREAGIHTAIETTGFASKQVLDEVLSVTDYVLYDLKHLDSKIHEKLTGRRNELILENARLVVASGVPTLFRCPLVPRINDTPENIKQTADFIKEVQGKDGALELMPYHRLGQAKYVALSKAYSLEGLKGAEPAYVESIQRSYEELGIRCTISR